MYNSLLTKIFSARKVLSGSLNSLPSLRANAKQSPNNCRQTIIWVAYPKKWTQYSR
ncbi:MAG: hypothetical protein IKZ88_07365 [Neisseriaceae bacterium]|nr:hypothetical protein [Neisseriaceae bacterium]MBR5941063.1 hypothetical protein [Neisseriaceae bacterium]